MNSFLLEYHIYKKLTSKLIIMIKSGMMNEDKKFESIN